MKGVTMGKRLTVLLLCAALVMSMSACGSSKKAEEEAEKAKQEEIKKENESAANAVIGAIEGLPENLKLKDETEVAGARAMYDALTDEQKKLVPSEIVEKLTAAEETIEEHRKIKEERDAEKEANKKAAKDAESVISGIPDKITLDAENAINQARTAYNDLTEDQKKFVSDSSLSKLTAAEKTLQDLKDEEEKKAEEEKKKKEEKEKKKAEKKAEKKKAAEEEKKQDAEKQDKYSIAKKYVGKKASALISAIGAPNKKKKNPNCATDGEEYIYYYDGFYVGVLSQTMDDPLIVQNVSKN